MRELFGDEGALAVARAGEAIVPGIRGFCEQHGADVWLREAGMIRVSTTPSQDETMDDEVEAARELGVPDEAVALAAEELSQRIRSPRFRSASSCASARRSSRPGSPARCGEP